jgi:hypothetical protein
MLNNTLLHISAISLKNSIVGGLFLSIGRKIGCQICLCDEGRRLVPART